MNAVKYWIMLWLVAVLGAGCATEPRQADVSSNSAIFPSRQFRADATIQIANGATALTVGEGSVWALTSDQLLKIDPQLNRLAVAIPRISVALSPVLTVGAGSVWVPRDDIFQRGVQRIDIKTAQMVTNIAVAGGNVAVGNGAVWVANPRNSTVARIDPKTNELVVRVRVARSPGKIVVGDDAVWVLHEETGLVSRIDPQRNEVTETIRIGRAYNNVIWVGTVGGYFGLAAGNGAIWVTSWNEGTIIRIDQTTRTCNSFHVAEHPMEIDISEGALWVGTFQGDLVKFDPLTNHCVERINVHTRQPWAVGAGALWLAEPLAGTISRMNL